MYRTHLYGWVGCTVVVVVIVHSFRKKSLLFVDSRYQMIDCGNEQTNNNDNNKPQGDNGYEVPEKHDKS